jgi:hypothetical protein
VRDFLHELAVAAADELPGCSCAIAVLRDEQLVPVAASAANAQRLDAIGMDGPHQLAAHESRVVHIADIRVETRWPRFRERALAEDVSSVVTSPIAVDEDHVTIGFLTVYSPEPYVFESTERQHRVHRVVGEASRAVSLAARLAKSERTSWHLEEALSSRSVIDQAIGILMAQNRCNADAAFQMLRSASQRGNVKLRTVAAQIVTSVGGQVAEPPSFRRP